MGKRNKASSSLRSAVFSLPFCILLVFAIGVVFRSLSAFKQSESEARLKDEVKALSEEFGLEFSETLAELVKRGIVSPSLAASLIRGEGQDDSNVKLWEVPEQDETDAEAEELIAEKEEEKEKEKLTQAGSDSTSSSSSSSSAAAVSDNELFENARHWMKPGEKYFVYQSSGGLSNQRIMLEYALLLGRILNRTVVVPGMGPHTSMWYNFNKIPLEDFLPSDDLLDAEAMRTITPILPIKGVTLKRFIAVNENPKTWLRIERNKLAEKRLNPWKLDHLMNTFGSVPQPVLFFARGTMWECFDFPPDLLDEARRAVRAHPSLRRVARDVSLRLFPKGFNALHIRFMDNDGTDLREGLLKPAPSFLYRMRKFDKTVPLYVATVPNRRKSAYFNAFKTQFTLVFGDMLERDADVIKALAGITRKMKETVLGLIEQLVCARAQRFLGTGFSTFSEHIRRMRRWRELAAVKDLTDVSDIENEKKFLSANTPCTNPLYPC